MTLKEYKKSAGKIILGSKYECYEDALEELDLKSLEQRRNEKLLKMDQKHSDKFIVNYANTERYFKSLIPYMQRLLNNDELENMDKQNDQKKCKRTPG